MEDSEIKLTQEEIYMTSEFRESLKTVIKEAADELTKVFLK